MNTIESDYWVIKRFNRATQKEEEWVKVYDEQYGVRKFEEFSEDDATKSTADPSVVDLGDGAMENNYDNMVSAKFEDGRSGMTAADLGVKPDRPRHHLGKVGRKLAKKLSRQSSNEQDAPLASLVTSRNKQDRKKKKDKEHREKDKKKSKPDDVAVIGDSSQEDKPTDKKAKELNNACKNKSNEVREFFKVSRLRL